MSVFPIDAEELAFSDAVQHEPLLCDLAVRDPENRTHLKRAVLVGGRNVPSVACEGQGTRHPGNDKIPFANKL